LDEERVLFVFQNFLTFFEPNPRREEAPPRLSQNEATLHPVFRHAAQFSEVNCSVREK